ncbi:MAG TPA: CRTAC1 family protein [Bryobacteraceae bacterium]|nr:CRTAC1 family protein [Bryobacteraceae bacterium]
MNPHRLTRRACMSLLAAPLVGRGQMSSRGVTPTARAKSSGLPFDASLTDIAAKAGLTAPVIYGGVDRNDYILEAIGCGAAFLDYDNDGWLDIFLLSGTRWEGAPRGSTNRLYHNNRNGTFTDVTEKAGLTRTGWACGVTVGDYNNDGFEDIFVTYWGHNVLYRNNGDGTFTDVTRASGLLGDEVRWSTGCTFVDYDRDGKLDLFVSRYMRFDPKKIPAAGRAPECNFKGVLVNCGPRGLPTDTHSLYHNNGDGTFTDVSVRAGIAAAAGSYGLTAVAADFNDDGWPDIYVACDSTPSLLFLNNRDGTFKESGLEMGVALNEDGQEQAGMGLGIGDFNLDGQLDILKTHFTEDTPALYANQKKAGFTDVTIRSGLGVETRFVSWGAGIVDLDNNGQPDLFWVTGSVYPEVERKLPQYPYRTPPILFRNLGNGRFEELFTEAGPGMAAAHSSRGCAFGDFDNDGDLDILIVNLNEPPSLLRNDIKGHPHWIKVKLVGVKSNRSAIGARVTVKYGAQVQAQEVLAQSSYLSADDRRLHFGLGNVSIVDLEVRWPSGQRQSFPKVAVDQLVTINEESGIVASQGFGPSKHI